MICYYDASDEDRVDSRDTYGFVIFLADGPIMWVSKKQSHVCVSMSHVEYMAMNHATREVVWLRDLITKMGFESMITKPTPLIGDNRAADILSREDMVTPGNRFYIKMFNFVKEIIGMGQVMTELIGTKKNVSDLLTKACNEVTNKVLRPWLCGYSDEPLPRGVQRDVTRVSKS